MSDEPVIPKADPTALTLAAMDRQVQAMDALTVERRRLSAVRWADHLEGHRIENVHVTDKADQLATQVSESASVLEGKVRAAHDSLLRESEIHRTNHQEEHVANRRAVDKAEANVAERLHDLNGVKEQLRDERGSYVSREVLDAKVQQISDSFADVKADISKLREFQASGEGRKKGIDSTTAAIYGVAILLIMLSGLMLSVFAGRH